MFNFSNLKSSKTKKQIEKCDFLPEVLLSVFYHLQFEHKILFNFSTDNNGEASFGLRNAITCKDPLRTSKVYLIVCG